MDSRFTSLVPALGRFFSAHFLRYCVILSLVAHQLLIIMSVLWTASDIHHVNSILLDLAYPMRHCKKYGDSFDRPLSEWCIRKCIPQCGRWNSSGHVHPPAASASYDHIHRRSLCWTGTWTTHWRLHLFLHRLVNPPLSSPQIR